MKRFWEKFEKTMVAISFAEEGLSEEAVKYLKGEVPVYSISDILNLKGVNIWFGVAPVKD